MLTYCTEIFEIPPALITIYFKKTLILYKLQQRFLGFRQSVFDFWFNEIISLFLIDVKNGVPLVKGGSSIHA